MTWTQPVCEERFRSIYPGREPRALLLDADEKPDLCCFCEKPTTIYIRIDPTTVPHPRETT
jgi:hypothetical protein